MSRVLLADDSPQALRLAEQILTREGMQVVSVSDGAIAFRRLPDVDPDILITDVYLPTKSGFDLARYIRSQEQLKHIRIVFAAGPNDEFDEQDARNAGADVILRKPLEASALLGAVQKLLSEGQNRKSSPDARKPGIDRNSIRAAVTLALDAAMPALVDELTERVVLALAHRA